MSSIARDDEGVYRWVSEYNLLRNPTVLITLIKIIGGVLLGLFALLAVYDLIEGTYSIISFIDRLRFDAIIAAIMFGLLIVGYVVFTLIQGGKYCVLFTMDEYGVTNQPLPKELKKAEAIGALNVLAGLATGNPTTVGIGLTSQGNSLTSNFANVRSIRGYRRRGTIKVNEPFAKNQVYVEKDDYDFVLDYIVQHCPNAKVTRGRVF